MSSSLVKKGFALIETDSRHHRPSTKSLVPQNKKVVKAIFKGQKKVGKINVLSSQTKITVEDIRQLEIIEGNQQTKEKRQKNGKKKKDCKQEIIRLDKYITKSIIKRAVTKRPVKEQKCGKAKKTAFTEEDFKSFESDYLKG